MEVSTSQLCYDGIIIYGLIGFFGGVRFFGMGFIFDHFSLIGGSTY